MPDQWIAALVWPPPRLSNAHQHRPAAGTAAARVPGHPDRRRCYRRVGALPRTPRPHAPVLLGARRRVRPVGVATGSAIVWLRSAAPPKVQVPLSAPRALPSRPPSPPTAPATTRPPPPAPNARRPGRPPPAESAPAKASHGGAAARSCLPASCAATPPPTRAAKRRERSQLHRRRCHRLTTRTDGRTAFRTAKSAHCPGHRQTPPERLARDLATQPARPIFFKPQATPAAGAAA